MASGEQRKRLLKARIAVALHDELGRVPTAKEIEQVFLLTRVMYKAVLGLHYRRKEQRAGQLALFWEVACSLATPASPRPTRPSACKRTPSPRPGASGCSPTPPAAPAPTGPGWTRRWTSCAPGTPWSSGGWTGWAARCATSSTP